MQINIKVTNKMIQLFLVGVARHTQSVQNNKLAVSQEGKDGVDFLHAHKLSCKLILSTLVVIASPAKST